MPLRPWFRVWRYNKPERVSAGERTLAQELYFKQALSHRILTHEEELALGRKAIQGDARAQEQLVLNNLKLVIPVAHYYASRFGVPLLDLIQEGNEGLMEAAKRYDPRKKLRFSTYAPWWIRHHITRALANDKRVRVPPYMVQQINRLQKVEERLLIYGIEPTHAAIARKTGLPESKVSQILGFEGKFESLSAPRYGEDYERGYEGKRVEDFVPSREPSAEDELAAKRLKSQIAALLPRLSRDHEAVIRARYLIPYPRSKEGTLEHAVNLLIHETEEDKATYQDIGTRVGPFLTSERELTRERIRQIIKEGIVKMRKFSKAA
ncbi:MAG: sigma-70 family RNA polymerase sigma factor [Candidatus Micrarchaeota archaeon]